ncbi:hypothetical protein CYMTET_32785, partial [Cymbomonas tetramitiformis]
MPEDILSIHLTFNAPRCHVAHQILRKPDLLRAMKQPAIETSRIVAVEERIVKSLEGSPKKNRNDAGAPPRGTPPVTVSVKVLTQNQASGLAEAKPLVSLLFRRPNAASTTLLPQ